MLFQEYNICPEGLFHNQKCQSHRKTGPTKWRQILHQNQAVYKLLEPIQKRISENNSGTSPYKNHLERKISTAWRVPRLRTSRFVLAGVRVLSSRLVEGL